VCSAIVTGLAVIAIASLQRLISRRKPSASQASAAAVLMQSRGSLTTSSNPIAGQEAPGDSAGGPPTTGVESMSVVAESTAYTGHIPAALENESGVDRGAPTSGKDIKSVANNNLADTVARTRNHTMDSADSGGGHATGSKATRSARTNSGRQSDDVPQGTAREGESPLRTPMTPSCQQRMENGMVPLSPPDEIDSRDCAPPLVIAADASLVDGLRALLVHHLKRSVGSEVVSLSTSQAELLEHHLSRLASYAQKIVHTLAFATRFLTTKQNGEGENSQMDGPYYSSGGNNPHWRPDGGQNTQHPQQPPPEPKVPRKSLKLSDDEILNIYKNAQVEAAIEADWRGIQGPTRMAYVDGDGTSRSGNSMNPSTVSDSRGGDQQYVKIFSRALQEPGRSPRALTAEILDPSKGVVCCHPGHVPVPTILNGGAGKHSPPLHDSTGASSSERYGQR